MQINKKIKLIIVILVMIAVFVSIVGFLIAYIPSKMSEKRTNEQLIVDLFIMK